MPHIHIDPHLKNELGIICAEMNLTQEQCIHRALECYVHDMKDYTQALNAQRQSKDEGHEPVLFDDLCKDIGLD